MKIANTSKHELASITTSISILSNNVRTLIQEIKDLQQESSSMDNIFTDMINDKNKSLVDHLERLGEYTTNFQLMEALSIVVGDDGVKKCIISDIIEILNNRVSFYLKRLNAPYSCVFTSDFNCTFITETGECSYENFSTGEKARINISILFAFREMLFNQGNLISSLLVLDEFLDSGLDTEAIDELMVILKELVETKQVEGIIMVSHRDCIDNSDFDRVFTVVKEGGFSTVQ